jgi:ABC-2 type transport system ATP-binding protein
MSTITETAPQSAAVGTKAIEVIGLTRVFEGGVTAVSGLDLAVERNTIYALLGPNGAGKTTTISILTTLLEPTDGRAMVNGYDVTRSERPVRESIGVTFQEMVLDDALTARQVLFYHGRLYGLSKRECREKADELLALVELTDAANRRCKTYSGGMKRRLELARALMTVPSVLFLDEPTLGLDPVGRERIWSYVRKLVRETDLAVLLTTHYLDEAAELADRVGIMDHGALVAEGTPAELIDSLGEDTVTLRGSGDAEALCRSLSRLEFVQSVTPVESGVLLGVASSSRRIAEIVTAAGEAGFELEDVSAAKPDLGAVFFKYTGHEMANGGEA